MMRPCVGDSKPAMRRRTVVLPHPDGPRRVTNSPWAMPSEASSTAVTSPSRARAGKVLVRCSQRQPEALAVVLRAQIARLDQLYGLIAVLCRHGRCRTGEDGVYKACVLLAIAPLVRDTKLKEVVLYDGLPQP